MSTNKTIFELMELSDTQKQGMFVALADFTVEECEELLMVVCMVGTAEYSIMPLDELENDIPYNILKIINARMVDCYDVKLSKVKADK